MLRRVNSGKFVWAHAGSVDEALLLKLKKDFKVHNLDLEDIQSEIHDPKLDTYKNYLFAIFNLPKYNAAAARLDFETLCVFLGKDFLVTVHKGNISETDALFARLEKNTNLRKDWLGRGVDFMLFKVLQNLFKARMKDSADIISSRTLEVEKNVFEESGKRNIRDLAVLRRNILFFRRLVDPQRALISLLGSARNHFVKDEYEPYFDDLRDFLNRIWARLENYKDTVDGLHGTNESLLSYRTNEIIKVLTIISVALMPLTLLSGIFGMNIPLPFADRPHYVFLGFAVLFVATVTALLILKRRKWF